MVVKVTKHCLDPFGKSYVQQRKQGIAASGGREIYVAFWLLMKRGTSTADSLLTSLLYARGLVWLLSPTFGRDSIVLVTTQLFSTIHYQGVNGNL
jgi:hypothetical protein